MDIDDTQKNLLANTESMFVRTQGKNIYKMDFLLPDQMEKGFFKLYVQYKPESKLIALKTDIKCGLFSY